MLPDEALWLIAGLVVLVPAGYWLARAMRLPAEALWFAFGLLAAGASHLAARPPLDTLDWLPQIIWVVVLPLFVFVRAFRIDRRALGFHLFPVIAITVLAIGFGTIATTGALAFLDRTTTPWIAVVVLGIVLSCTDASAVTTMLKRLVPRGVPILLGGEAALACAVAYVSIDVAVAASSSTEPARASTVLETFAIAFGGGAAIGTVVAVLGLALARYATNGLTHGVLPAPLVAAFALCAHQAAQALGVSGVAACLVAGLGLGAATDPTVEQRASKSFEVAIRGSLFVLGGAWWPIVFAAAKPAVLALAVVAMCAGRLAALRTLTWTAAKLARMGLTPRERRLLAAFSARGASTIGLALALGATTRWAPAVQSIALAVVAFDLLVTVPASHWLARQFGNPPFHAPQATLAAIDPRSPH